MGALGEPEDLQLKLLTFLASAHGKQHLAIKRSDLEDVHRRFGLGVAWSTSDDEIHLHLYSRQPTLINPPGVDPQL
jgi:hypothetical protein